ncbi:S-adenosyl-L-methionine-dependent methyltransferases superfamily protein [Euphorbia peplus]|nr:S-adenosyl-L-methionine-dependent methyltransferases superfamily protein [Euphorbia peplus]
MKVNQVLHMNAGEGDTSYAQNSLLQQKVIAMTKPIVEEAMTKFYTTKFPKCLSMADLGCSSGPNTLVVTAEIIGTVEKLCRKIGHESPEYQVFLNDLPGNDFNTIFRSLPSLNQESCFFNGVPGSFYGRLFPTNSLHFVHSSYSLMWLSQVPEMVESNKGNIYMAESSPESVLKAYYNQFKKDLSTFLVCRSKELVASGHMVLTFLGRRSEDPSSNECCYIWQLLATVLNQMVSEGVIEEESLDSFNIPQYTPSPFEVKSEIVKEGSFSIDRLEVSEINWNAYYDDPIVSEQHKDQGYNVASCMRAVAEPLLVAHFGFDDQTVSDIFHRYRCIVADRMTKEKTNFINITVSVTKKKG